jgi:hypothetical protein
MTTTLYWVLNIYWLIACANGATPACVLAEQQGLQCYVAEPMPLALMSIPNTLLPASDPRPRCAALVKPKLSVSHR